MSRGRFVKTSPVPDSFPSDFEIRQAFIGVRADETFLSSEIPARRALYDQFAARYAPKKSLEDVFPKVFLIYRAGQSGECYNDFIDRCCRIFAEQSSGDVFLLSKWPDGPSEPDSLFNAVEFPTFIQNPRIRRIYLVNPDDLSQRIQFWPKNPDDPDRVETAPEDEALARMLDTLTVGAGVAAGGLELLRTGIGSLLNPFYVPETQKLTPQNNQEQAPGESRLDSFFVDTASLPENSEFINSDRWFFTDGSGDATPLFTTIPDYGTEAFALDTEFTTIPDHGTEAFAPDAGDGDANDDMITFATISETESDSPFSFSPSEFMDPWGYLAKRQLTLHSRACALRPGLERDLPFLFEGSDPTYFINEDQQPANTILFPGALPAYATIHVVQRRISDDPTFYKLDIEIRNSADQLIGSAMDADGFPNQRVEVQSQLPYRVRVWTQEGDEHQPVKFQYGPTGAEWDSNDSNPETHDCKTDEWRQDHRELDCKFVF